MQNEAATSPGGTLNIKETGFFGAVEEAEGQVSGKL